MEHGVMMLREIAGYGHSLPGLAWPGPGLDRGQDRLWQAESTNPGIEQPASDVLSVADTGSILSNISSTFHQAMLLTVFRL